MTDLLDLAERCETESNPTRELDAEIARATGWVQKSAPIWGLGAPHWWKDHKCQSEIIGHWHGPHNSSLPHFSASVDAALTLVPERYHAADIGEDWQTGKWKARAVCRPSDGQRRAYSSGGTIGLVGEEGVAATCALAICAAALRTIEIERKATA